jgi:hypothetical protein
MRTVTQPRAAREGGSRLRMRTTVCPATIAERKTFCSCVEFHLRLRTHERLNDVRCRNILLYIIAHTRDACIQQYNSTADVI